MTSAGKPAALRLCMMTSSSLPRLRYLAGWLTSARASENLQLLLLLLCWLGFLLFL